MIEIKGKGDYKKTKNFLNDLASGSMFKDLDKYGEMGVRALSRATPVDTGLASRSWGYRIIKDKKRPGIEWYNTNVENGTSVVILIQYGHGTKNGRYVQGRDFINPAIRPVFDYIADSIWREVIS